MKTIVVCVLAALSLAACASGPVEPYAHNLTAERIALMGPTRVSIADNLVGVTPTWPVQNASGGGAYIPTTPAGGAGMLLVAGFDAMMNSEPQRRANQTADEFDAVMNAEAINASLEAQFRRLMETPPADGIVVSDVVRVMKIDTPDQVNGALEIMVSYQISDNANGLRVTATATYRSPEGIQLYNNMFTYYAAELPAPTLTPQGTVSLINAIEKRARDANGQLPRTNTAAYVDYTRDLREARDDFLTRAEKAILVTEVWNANDGALLKRELQNAQALIARYVVLDLNTPAAAPDALPTSLVVETLPDGRTVRRTPDGYWKGVYEFHPAGPRGTAVFSTGTGVSRNQQNLNRWRTEQAAARRATR